MIRKAVLGPCVAALAAVTGPAKAQEFRVEAGSRLSAILPSAIDRR
jgi:hypothetical protein